MIPANLVEWRLTQLAHEALALLAGLSGLLSSAIQAHWLVWVLVLMSISSGTLYYGTFRLRSWIKGTSVPFARFHPLFGIPVTVRLIKSLGKNKMLETLQQHQVETNKLTILEQRIFHWAINTVDPENIKTVLSTQFKDYTLGLREYHLGPAFGAGIFTTNGKEWKHSRNLLRPQFSRDQISQLGSVTEHVNKLVKGLPTGFVDAQPLFHQLAIDTSTEFLFGESLNTLDEPIDGQLKTFTFKGKQVTSKEFVESYVYMLHISVQRAIWGPFFFLVDGPEFRRHIKRARVVVDMFVDKALNASKTTGSYVFSHELAKQTQDPIQIRDQIFNLLIAGRDTTASTMTFICFYLARNPGVMQKLRAVVLEEFGSAQESRPISFEMLRGCKYLNAVINEVLRLEPAVPFNFRTANRDTVLPRGGGPDESEPVLVTWGTPVSYQTYTLHRLEEFWGKDAHKFRPERWMEPSNVPNWAYIPFNGGPRICLGQQFAMNELALTWVRLVQHFREIEPGPELPLEPVHAWALNVKLGSKLDVRFVK